MKRGTWFIGAGRNKGEVTLFDWSPKEKVQVPHCGTRTIELTDLYVPPGQRKLGWGRILVTTALKYANRYNWAVIIRIYPYGPKKMKFEQLETFYKSFGFKHIANEYYYLPARTK